MGKDFSNGKMMKGIFGNVKVKKKLIFFSNKIIKLKKLSGEIIKGNPCTNVSEMNCKNLKINWKGDYIFKQNRRIGKGILVENGKEYFVENNLKGNEISRSRTFEGIRLMIIGNRFFFIIF